MNPVFHRPTVNPVGVSGCNLCEAHLFIGMTRLAEGDRVGAREDLRKSVVARVFEFFEHDRSRTLLVWYDSEDHSSRRGDGQYRKRFCGRLFEQPRHQRHATSPIREEHWQSDRLERLFPDAADRSVRQHHGGGDIE